MVNNPMAYVHHKTIPTDGTPPYLTCGLALRADWRPCQRIWESAVTNLAQVTCPRCRQRLHNNSPEHPLHAIRRQLGYSRAQMAEALDVKPRYYQSLEQGRLPWTRALRRATRLLEEQQLRQTKKVLQS